MIAIQQDAAAQEAAAPAEARYDEALLRVQVIEDELQRLGRWQDAAPPATAFESKAAFFADTMTLAQWLQFVLVPHVREVCADRGEFPASSSIAAHAVREFDGDGEAATLLAALASFDQLVDSGSHSETMDAIANVRRFVDASKRKDEAAARAEMIDAQKNAEGGAPPAIDRYFVRDVLVDGDLTVVMTSVQGENPMGQIETMEMPFVSIRENGRAKVDMERTMARLMGGTGHDPSAEIEGAMTGALDAMGKQMQSAADDFERERIARENAEFATATQAFARDELPAFNATIDEALGKQVMIAIDWSGAGNSTAGIWDLRRQLEDDLPVALRSMNDDKRAALARQIDVVRIQSTRDRAERGARVDGDTLQLTLALGTDDPRIRSYELTCWLDWEMDAEGREFFRHPVDQAHAWWIELRTNHAFDLEQLDLNLLRFSSYPEQLRAQWALHELAVLGVDSVGRVLAGLLDDDAEFAAVARERLKAVRFDAVDEVEQQSVEFDGFGLTITLYSNEGAPGFGSDDVLRERIRAAVLSD